jgi:hypothetical protein
MARHIKVTVFAKRYFQVVFIIAWFSVTAGCTSNTLTPAPEISAPVPNSAPSQILFDDFSYADVNSMSANGWIVRRGQGWPGVTGATFRPENVSFMEYPNPAGNRLLRMTSSTDGMSENTYQTQICHRRKYLDGTYASRVRFNDEPVSGSDGDQIVETFYMITPYDQPLNPDYSEMDFEYLPNGGWGGSPTTMHFTTWETVRVEPWLADNASNSVQDRLAGWHTLVAQVTGGTVRYFVDGRLTAQHGGEYYPDAPMSINFNLWFIEGGLNSVGDVREYQEDIDWVFHEVGVSRMPDEVNAKVDELRSASVAFQDTVSPGAIALVSPCDL